MVIRRVTTHPPLQVPPRPWAHVVAPAGADAPTRACDTSTLCGHEATSQWHAAPGELWAGRSQMQRLAPGVWISNMFGAKNRDLLCAHHITHIVVCAAECVPNYPDPFQYLVLQGFVDNTHTALAPHLQLALPWIAQAVEAGGQVLLHCASGSSCSGAVAVAYVMRERCEPLADALGYVQRIRPIVAPNPGFLEQLLQHAPSAPWGPSPMASTSIMGRRSASPAAAPTTSPPAPALEGRPRQA